MCKKLLFLISFVSVLAMAGSAFAVELTVSPNDPPEGERWYTTIESAYAAANTGDIITIHAATDGGTLSYTAGYTPGTFKQNDSKHDITFRRYGNDNIRISEEFGSRYHTGWTIDGLSFSSNVPSNYGVALWNYNGFHQNNWNIKNCIFYNLNSHAIYGYASNANNSSSNVTVENCTFFNLTVNDAIQAYYAYDWTVKDCIFQSIHRNWDNTSGWTSGDGMNARNNANDVYLDYCTFYDNGRDVAGTAHYGINATTDEGVQFAFDSTNPDDPHFLWLLSSNSAAVLTGDSQGGYRGARPAPEPATIALLGLGGLALLRRKR
jgi:hypothetical protein